MSMPTPIKYVQLTDKEFVRQKLIVDKLSPAQLAKEVGCPRSSVDWVIKRYLSQEEASQVRLERVHKGKIK